MYSELLKITIWDKKNLTKGDTMMKKSLILILALAMTLSIILTGCGEKVDDTENPDSRGSDRMFCKDPACRYGVCKPGHTLVSEALRR